MPDTLEKQLKKEILKRQKQNKPKKKTALVLAAILFTVSLLLGIGQWQVKKSAPAQPQQPFTAGGNQSETI